KIDLKRSKSQSLDEENGPSPPLHKKQGFSNSLINASIFLILNGNPLSRLKFLQFCRNLGHGVNVTRKSCVFAFFLASRACGKKLGKASVREEVRQVERAGRSSARRA
ncbi:MAG: hypothetical protein E6230_22480, partial [Paenibacillus dendritiformis]|nr:hypothetical protein [Paenibacillus dendritiformis]